MELIKMRYIGTSAAKQKTIDELKIKHEDEIKLYEERIGQTRKYQKKMLKSPN